MADAACPEISPPRDPLGDAFVLLAIQSGTCLCLITLAAFGPRLWASQRVEGGAIAVEIIAVGQVLLAAIAWPLWTCNAATSIAIIAGSSVWLLLAGQIALRSNGDVASIGWKLSAALVVLAIVRAATPRPAIAFAWTMIVAFTLGTPAILYLARDY